MNINLFDEKLILQQGKCRLLPSMPVINSAEKSAKKSFFYLTVEIKNVAITLTIFHLGIDIISIRIADYHNRR
jgi:hypothetical protein